MASDEITLDREAFKALAADTRVAILKKLSKRRMTGAELSEETGLSASTVKEHLDTLEKVGLIAPVKEEVKRKWKYYGLTLTGRKIVQPKGVPAQVWLVLGLVVVGLVFFLQVASLPLNPFGSAGAEFDSTDFDEKSSVLEGSTVVAPVADGVSKELQQTPARSSESAEVSEPASVESDSVLTGSSDEPGSVERELSGPLSQAGSEGGGCFWDETDTTDTCTDEEGTVCEMPKGQDPASVGGLWCICENNRCVQVLT
ncbi:MAG: winged helix-turn-helix domain-containing protein [Candidatus Micrarchaeia archaeon]